MKDCVRLVLAVLLTILVSAPAFSFDHGHTTWDELLHEHVRWTREGVASAVDYAGFHSDRGALLAYLKRISAVAPGEFARWSRDQRLAFLINAYNAYTVELVLRHHGEIDSIRDIGRFWETPWRIRFFTLLGEERNLDDIEHGLIRNPGDYDEPRIHFAVNCASVGCPALRPEAFRAIRLEAQLQDSMRRFLKDRQRNRYNGQENSLEVSSIFEWYGSDFVRKWGSLESFFAEHAEWLSASPFAQERIRRKDIRIAFLDYDWRLNTAARRVRSQQTLVTRNRFGPRGPGGEP